MAPGRSRNAGVSTCSTKALNTAVLVAAAMLMQAITPSRAKAPITVRRFQWPQGDRAERSLAPHRPGMRPRQPCVDPALVEEDQTLGVDPGQLGAPCRPLLSEVGAVLLLGPEGFLRTRPSRLSARHKVEPLARAPVRSASRSAYSASVEAFASATRVRRTSRTLPSSRRGGPPRAGLAVRRPSVLACCCQR